MQYTKKFTPIQITDSNKDNVQMVELQFGRITGPYYDREYPYELFDSEDDAIKHAYKINEYATWMIVPVIEFKQNY